MPIALKSVLHHPSSWSMLLAETIGQLVKYTSFQSRSMVDVIMPFTSFFTARLLSSAACALLITPLEAIAAPAATPPMDINASRRVTPFSSVVILISPLLHSLQIAFVRG